MNARVKKADSTRKILISLLLGGMGFVGCFLNVGFSLPPFRMNLIWSLVFPLTAALAYGPVYGLIAGIFGGSALFPFFLWPDNGWACLIITVGTVLFLVWHGENARRRLRKPSTANHPLVAQLPFALVFALAICLGYPWAFSLNPAPWSTENLHSMPFEVVAGIAVGSIVVYYIQLVAAILILELAFVREILGLPVSRKNRGNGPYLAAGQGLALVGWLSMMVFDSVFLERTFPYGALTVDSSYELMSLAVFFGMGILFSAILIRFNQKFRQSERAARLSHQFAGTIMESTPILLLGVNDRGDLMLFNKAAETLTGYAFAELRGRNWFEILVPPGRFPEVRNNRPPGGGADAGFPLEHPILTKSGEEKDILWARRVLYEGGRTIGTLSIGMEITEKRQSLGQLERIRNLEALTALSGGIAHDFNNLLTGLFGFLQLAQTELKDRPGAAPFMETAQMVFDRAKDLADQLLDFSRRGRPEWKLDSLGPLVRRTVDFAMSGSAVRWQNEIAPDLWPCVFDRHQIARVIENLVLNARQAMVDRGRLAVSANNVHLQEPIPGLPPGRYVRISVSDDGPGMTPEIVSRLFVPFFTTKPQGIGLGLATAFSTLKAHRGHISVETEPGKGTVFHIFLPAAAEEREDA